MVRRLTALQALNSRITMKWLVMVCLITCWMSPGISAASYCPAGVTCEVCPDTRDCNIIPGLPRLNYQGVATSPNVVDYDFFVCTNVTRSPLGHPIKKGCSSPYREDFSKAVEEDITKMTTKSSNPRSTSNYVFALTLYIGLMVTLGLAILIYGIVLAFRYCTCCCADGGFCGSWYPTRRVECTQAKCCCVCCPCLGYEEVTDEEGKIYLRYPERARWCVRIYAIIFICAVASFIIVGQVKGANGLPEAIKNTDSVSTPVLQMAEGVAETLTSFIQRAASGPVTDTLRTVNTSISNSVQLHTTVQASDCVVSVIATSLPDLTPIWKFVTDVNVTISNITTFFNTAPILLTNVTNGTTLLRGEVATLSGQMNNATTAIDTTKADLSSNFTRDITPIIEAFDSWQNPTQGAQALVNNATELAYATAPADGATVLLTSTDNDGTLDQYGSTPGTMSDAQLDALLGRLIVLQESYQNITSHSSLVQTTHQLLVQSNANSDKATALQFEKIEAHLQTARDRFASVTTNVIANINNSVNNMVGVLDSISFDPMRSELTRLDKVFTTLPSTDVFIIEIDKVLSLDRLFPCLLDLISAVEGLNTSVVDIGPIPEIYDIREKFNSTLDTLRNASKDFNETQKKLTDQINTAALSKAINDSDTYRIQLIANLKQRVNLTYIQQQADSAINAIQLDPQLQANITIMKSNLSSSQHPPSFVAAVGNVLNDLTPLTTALDTLKEDVLHYRQGRCQVALTINCTVDAQCPSGTCSGFKTGKCRNAGTLCSLDTQCASGDRCVIDPTRTANVKNGISSLMGKYNATQLAIAAGRALVIKEGTSMDLLGIARTFNQTVNSANADFSPVTTALSSALNTMDTSDFNPNSLLTSVRETFETASSTTVTDVETRVQQMQDTYNDATSHIPRIKDVQKLLHTVYNFTTVELHKYVDVLTISSLQETRAAQGTAAMIRQLLSVPINATAFLAGANTTLLNITSWHYDIAQDLADKIDVLGNYQHLRAGPLHLAAKLYPRNFGFGPALDPWDPIIVGGTMFRTASGNRYPSFRTCYTNGCIARQVDYIWRGDEAKVTITQTLRDMEVIKEQDEAPVPAGFTLEVISAVGYVIPALAVIFTIFALVLVCEHKALRFTQSFCASASLCCQILQVPCILIILLLIFPTSVILGDVCYSAESIAVTEVIPQFEHCEKLQGELLPSGMCRIHIDGGGVIEFSTEFDSYLALQSIFGDCDPQTDGIHKVTAALTDSLAKVPDESINKNIRPALDNFRNPLQHAIFQHNGTWSTVFRQAGVDLSRSLSCQQFTSVYKGAKSVACCHITDAYWWIVSSWFLIVWSMVLCGIPSMTLARKRLAYRPWGPYVSKELNPDGGELSDVEYIPKGAINNNFIEGDMGLNMNMISEDAIPIGANYDAGGMEPVGGTIPNNNNGNNGNGNNNAELNSHSNFQVELINVSPYHAGYDQPQSVDVGYVGDSENINNNNNNNTYQYQG